MYLHNDLDDTENQFQWWLGELGHYLLTEYKMNIISMGDPENLHQKWVSLNEKKVGRYLGILRGII